MENEELARTTVFLPEIMRHNLKLLAIQSGTTMSALIREAVDANLESTYGIKPGTKIIIVFTSDT